MFKNTPKRPIITVTQLRAMSTHSLGSRLKQQCIRLDGTTLEGGGQLLRLALSISSLTCIPIHITDIRGNRAPRNAPDKGGGLKQSHLAGVQWLAKAVRAETVGMEVKSRELVFRPILDEVGCDNRDSSEGKELQSEGKVAEGENGVGVWKDVYQDSRLVRRETYIPMPTPGSIFLVLQAMLPYILFSAPSSPFPGLPDPGNVPDKALASSAPVPLRITFQGGTNVSKSPSYEYVSQVLLPMLHQKIGLPPMTTTLHRRGWTTGTTAIGRVTFDITPLQPGSHLPAFELKDRGHLEQIHVSILGPDASTRATVRDLATSQLLQRWPEVEISFPIDEDSKHPKRLYLLLVAETSNNYRLGRDWLYDRKLRSPTDSAEAPGILVNQVVRELEDELRHGGCVDEYMEDQLVVFQALAQGRSWVDIGKGREASLHTRTARWVVERLSGVGFDGMGACDGVGFRVGERFWERAEEEKELVEEMGKVTV